MKKKAREWHLDEGQLSYYSHPASSCDSYQCRLPEMVNVFGEPLIVREVLPRPRRKKKRKR